MMRKPKTRFSGRKRTAAGISIVLAAAILLGGTYAWQSMNEQGNSAAKGQPGPAGGRLHDDWEVVGADYGITEWSETLTANKDIYVENYESDGLDNDGNQDNSEVGRDIFVRVKLYEYMETGGGATLDSGDADYATRAAQPLIAGTDRDDLSTWSPRVPGADIASDQFRARWNWAFGGQKTYMPTFNKDNHSRETDVKGDAIDPNDPLTTGEPMNQTKRGGANAYAYPAAAGDPDAGTHDYFDTVTIWQAPEKVWDETLGSGGSGDHSIGGAPVEHTAKATENGSVITMAQWKTSPYNSQKGNYWVVDTDGWFYWANPIAPETATGLLLDSITLQGEPDDEWYYCVYVKSQAATGGDWMQGSDGNGFYVDPGEQPSADAENLLNIITDHLPAVAGVYLSQTTAAVDVNGSLSLTAQVTTENTEDAAWKAVTWSITPGVGSRFSNGIFSPSATDADKWFTIKATSVKDPLKYAECRVYVPRTDQGVVVGADGNVYLYYVGGDDNTYQKVNPDGTLGALVCPIEVGNPGAPTDRINVVTIGGQHYLDEGDDRHYYAVGPDGKLGTADDVLVYDSDGNGTMLPSDTMVNMTISPANPTVMVGNTLDLTVTAIFEGGAQDVSGVTWAIISTGHAPGTTITGTGGTVTLAADENESKTAVTVRATYPGVHGTSKDVTVAISRTESFVTSHIAGVNIVHAAGMKFFGGGYTMPYCKVDGQSVTTIAAPPGVSTTSSWSAPLFAWNNRLFCIGAGNVWEYNIAANTWSVYFTHSYTIGRACVTVYGDKAYVTTITTNGTVATSETRDGAVVDMNAKTVTYMTNKFAQRRGWGPAIRYGSYVYMIGGSTVYPNSSNTTIERWDMETDTVETIATGLPFSGASGYAIQVIRVSETEAVLANQGVYRKLDLVTGALTTTTAPYPNLNPTGYAFSTDNENTYYMTLVGGVNTVYEVGR